MADPITLQEARIVQIGWSVHAAGGEPTVKEFIVCPTGFRISNEANVTHGVTVKEATTSGASLQEVLIEFMRDVSETRALGGRLVAHHLAFDAGIVMKELARAGLTHTERYDAGRTASLPAPTRTALSTNYSRRRVGCSASA